MRTRRFEHLTWILALGLALGSTGCFWFKSKPALLPPPQLPPKFDLNVTASPTLNRDPEGNPLSVVVRFFMLKDKAEFSKLTFDVVSSSRTEAEMLGADFLGKSEIVVVPGATYAMPQDLLAGTKYIGVVAFFRKPDPNYWRYLVSVDSMMPVVEKTAKKDKNKPLPNPKLTFKVEDCYLVLSGLKPEPIPGQPENAKPDCGSRPAAPALATPPAEVSKPKGASVKKGN